MKDDPLAAPGGGRQTVQIGGDWVLEVSQAARLVGFERDHLEDLVERGRLFGDH